MDKLDYFILGLLIFPETYQNIIEECSMERNRYVIADVLKRLIHDELITPMQEDENGQIIRSLVYDSDVMDAFRYQITSKGIRILEREIQ